jgi:quercetin dioxygenase-like cupin family protein
MKVIHYTDVEAQDLTVAGPGVSCRVVIGKADDDVNFCMRVIELQPGSQVPAHTHPWEHQQFYHSGVGYVVKDGEKIPVGPGNVVYVAPGEKHYVKNTGDEPLVFVCLVPKTAPEM